MDIMGSDRSEIIGVVDGEICKGQCEGSGVISVYVHTEQRQMSKDPSFVHPESETDATLIKLWHKLEKEGHSPNGWHFVECPECGGSGKVN